MALLWTVTPGLEECLAQEDPDQSGFYSCAFATAAKKVSVAQSVPIETNFPASFRVPIHALPEPDFLGGKDGNYLGKAVLVVYSDGNRNGRLDLTPNDAIEPVDRVLSGGHFEYTLIYREGELSPLWRTMAGCAEPPQGFSLVLRDVSAAMACQGGSCDFPCQVHGAEAEIELRLGAKTLDDREIICEPAPAEAQERQYPHEPPPPGAATRCTESGFSLFVNAHPERYCTRANTLHYSLWSPNGAWDIQNNPPSWWPCPVLQVDLSGTPPPVEGLYRVTSFRRNDSGCEEEGPTQTPPFPLFRVQQEPFFSKLFQSYSLALYSCNSAAECSTSFDLGWGVWGFWDGTWQAETTSSALVGADCKVTDWRILVRPIADPRGVRLERKESSALVKLQPNQSCTGQYASVELLRNATLHCDDYQVVIGLAEE